MFLFITALIFMFISKLRFPKKVSIVKILNLEFSGIQKQFLILNLAKLNNIHRN